MKLFELFNRPAEINIMTAGIYLFKAAFHVGDRTIVFRGDKNSAGIWYLSFYQLGSGFENQVYDMTNDGGEFDVMSTVKKLMDIFIEKYQPKEILFSASKSEDSRVKVYHRMVSRYMPPNYERDLDSKFTDPEFVTFHIKRKEQ